MFEHEIDKNINTGIPKASHYFGEFKKYLDFEDNIKTHIVRKSIFKIRKKNKEDENNWIKKETGLIRIKKNDIVIIKEKWWMRIFKK